MNIQNVLKKLDAMFEKEDRSPIEPFLLEQINTALRESDIESALTLLNELMGYYRAISRFEDGIRIADKSIALLEQIGAKGSIPYATTLLNAATVYRAAGKTDQAIDYYSEVMKIYQNQNVDSYLLSSLYNNLSLAYQEKEDFLQAIFYLEQALEIIQKIPDATTELASTYTNLAICKLHLNRLSDAKENLEKAVSLFLQKTPHSSHYTAALNALGEVSYKEGHFKESIQYYENALDEIEKYYGKNMYYAVTMESLASVYESIDIEKSRLLMSEAKKLKQSFTLEKS